MIFFVVYFSHEQTKILCVCVWVCTLITTQTTPF